MKLYSTPGRIVTKRVRIFGKLRVKPIFKFDSNGEYDLDESKFDKTDIAKLKRLFSRTESVVLSDDEIRLMAKEAKIKSYHVKSIDRLKEELGV